MKISIRTVLVTALLVFLTFGAVQKAGAQNDLALKTNLLHDATASFNLSAEYAMASKWTIQLGGAVRLFDAYNVMLNHWLVRPEVRYWLCEDFNGFFVGGYGMAGVVNAGHLWDLSAIYHRFPNLKNFLLKDASVFSAGATGGYDWILGRHWNLELAFSLGYMFVKGDEYNLSVDDNGKYYLAEDAKPLLTGSIFDYTGPTALSVSIVYLF